jgi:sporulation integral membrane protein YlbJ
MMNKKSLLCVIMASIAMLVLILDSKTAFSGASDGITLCLTTVIPSLFPFFVISILLTGFLPSCSTKFLHPIGKILHLPENTEPLLLMGFLGGYPVGAQCIRQMYDTGNLSRSDANRMLSFCSNAGPAFIFGIGSAIMPDTWMCWLLWLVHILSAMIVGWITPREHEHYPSKIRISPLSITDAVNRSIRVMAMVCSWIVLFRVIITFLQKWFLWMLPQELSIFFSGLFELANGCTQLSQVESISSRFLLFSVFLSFGGLCVALQTHAVLWGSDLVLRPYLLGKVVQGAVSCLICALVIPVLPDQISAIRYVALTPPSLFIYFLYCIYCRRNKKRYSIPAPAGI